MVKLFGGMVVNFGIIGFFLVFSVLLRWVLVCFGISVMIVLDIGGGDIGC